MLKVVIADDHPLIRKGLKQILSESLYFGKVDEAGEGKELMELLRKEPYDVVILDISLPGKDGLELLKDIKALYPSLPVLILSIHPEEQYALRALKSGASGCLNKASAPEELVAAIRRIVTGGTYITPVVEELLLKDLKRTQGQLPHQTLSDREYQVFLLLASGKTPTEIAEKLSLSVKTISTYRMRLLEKMGLKTNAQLTQYAFKHGLLH
ncbi:MAG: response regulator transcription factor [Spirochaetales bacterium]